MRARAVLTAIPLMTLPLLAACGGGQGDASGSPSDSAAGTDAAGGSTAAADTACRSITAVPADSMADAGSGLRHLRLAEGRGRTAGAGDTVAVHYTGCLTDGTRFDSSRDRGRPIRFVLGTGRVIQGWDQGIQGMKVGGRRILRIPPELAYGSRGSGPIPPDATLLFRVELMAVNPGGSGGGG